MNSLKGAIAVIALAFASCFASDRAEAATQCESTVVRIWAGDGGYIWIHLASGGAAVIAPSDPSREAITALAITALTTGRTVIVRFQTDALDCTAAGASNPVLGLYLL